MEFGSSLKTGEALGEARTAGAYHVPVLLPEVMTLLQPRVGGTYVDATLGGGGYAEAILKQLGDGTLYGFETDPAAKDFAAARIEALLTQTATKARFEIVGENFGQLLEAMKQRGVTELDGIVYDLGVSSHQLDTNSIGLSYRVEGPLDMRLDPRLDMSAKEVIADYSEEELRRIFREYGEEPRSGQIAHRIAVSRLTRPIETTTELARIISSGIREDKRNATLSRIFQAIRIEVNHELEQLERSLRSAIAMLKPGGRIVVVSYHSLEDRIVKTLFQRESSPVSEPGSPSYLKSAIDHARASLTLLTKRPVGPSEEEAATNPRARSAKLRAAEKR